MAPSPGASASAADPTPSATAPGATPSSAGPFASSAAERRWRKAGKHGPRHAGSPGKVLVLRGGERGGLAVGAALGRAWLRAGREHGDRVRIGGPAQRERSRIERTGGAPPRAGRDGGHHRQQQY